MKAYSNMTDALYDFESQELTLKIRDLVTQRVDEHMKGHEHNLPRYQSILTACLNSLVSATGGCLLEMKFHAHAHITEETVLSMHRELVTHIMEVVKIYEQTGKCPGCETPDRKDISCH